MAITVGDVERRPVPAAIVDVDEVDDGAEAGPVDQIPHGAAEDQADRAVIGPPAARQDPEGHLHQDHERADRQERHDPPPLGRDAREEAEPCGRGRRHPSNAVTARLADAAQLALPLARTTGTQRSQSPGCARCSPTRSLHVQQRWYLRPSALSTPMTRPGISWLSYWTAALVRAPPSSTCDTMKSVGRSARLARSSSGRSSGAAATRRRGSSPLPISPCAPALSSALVTSRRTSSTRPHSRASALFCHSLRTSRNPPKAI